MAARLPRSRLPSPRSLAIGAAILAVPGIPWLHVRAQRLEVEHRAAVVASALTNRSIRVICPGPLRRRLMYEIHEGSVMFDADGVPVDETRLSAATCDGLRTVLDRGASLDFACLATGCPERERQAAQALAVLTHEIMHLRGTRDEAAAECQAGKRVADVAQRLGVAPAGAAAVATWQATDWQNQLPDNYKNGAC
ncbi:hypothetical protein DSM104299_05217 [Baekduia alba]|uniref:hypothetical protein n=1 Tax=Baekduia alba TaxID=2997333 RepID=UPI0023413E56|nr:hypothetical protein [Baekduia alba]WCB96458.1 hypothetical protein DSM104299_05217 [Baekduia alba]